MSRHRRLIVDSKSNRAVSVEYGWLDEALDLNAEAQTFRHQLEADPSSRSIGAIAEFSGIVKGFNPAGEEITALEIEVWIEQATHDCEQIVQSVVEKYPVERITALHRYGVLGVGEPIVYCAAASPDRGTAFAAASALIEHFKGDVAVWKREHKGNTATWVEGKPYRGLS